MLQMENSSSFGKLASAASPSSVSSSCHASSSSLHTASKIINNFFVYKRSIYSRHKKNFFKHLQQIERDSSCWQLSAMHFNVASVGCVWLKLRVFSAVKPEKTFGT